MRQEGAAAWIALALAVVAMSLLWVVSLEAQTAISADGKIESTSGGFVFPDGTVQMTAAAPGSAPVEDTGQQACWNASGTPISCSGTGQDGELQRGVDWPTPRFADNLDGTVTDILTGLIWLKDANCPPGVKTWQQALDWVADLNTTSIACTDYTALTFTDWRLPNIKELLSLLDYGQAAPALPSGHPFENVAVTSSYWSSSSRVTNQANAWIVNLNDVGGTFSSKVVASAYVWPVRGGE